jgi:oxaloacetate decarboxylase (Na+ extruding) subunit gamma
MHEGLFNEGLILMMLGMGFVYFFLIFLVGSMKLLSSTVNKYFNTITPEPSKIINNKKDNENNNDDEIVAVIASVLHHRKLS